MTLTPLSSIKDAVRQFIHASINIDGLGDDADLFESGIVNSLFAVQLMTFLERTFEIEIGTEDLDIGNFKSIDATAAFVARKLAARTLPASPPGP